MKVNGKDYPIYYGKKHVPNHQPVIIFSIWMEHQVANQVIAIWSIPRLSTSPVGHQMAPEVGMGISTTKVLRCVAWCFWDIQRRNFRTTTQFVCHQVWYVSDCATSRLCRYFFSEERTPFIYIYIYIWVWVNTYRYIFSGMNIHLPAILGFTRYQGFDTLPYLPQLKAKVNNRAPKNQFPTLHQMQNLLCFLSSLACLPMRHFSVFLPSDGLHISWARSIHDEWRVQKKRQRPKRSFEKWFTTTSISMY